MSTCLLPQLPRGQRVIFSRRGPDIIPNLSRKDKTHSKVLNRSRQTGQLHILWPLLWLPNPELLSLPGAHAVKVDFALVVQRAGCCIYPPFGAMFLTGCPRSYTEFPVTRLLEQIYCRARKRNKTYFIQIHLRTLD